MWDSALEIWIISKESFKIQLQFLLQKCTRLYLLREKFNLVDVAQGAILFSSVCKIF